MNEVQGWFPPRDISLQLGADSGRSPFDPTHTEKLRRSFCAAAIVRLNQTRAAMRKAVIDHDVLGLRGSMMAYHTEEVRLTAFNKWFEMTTIMYFDGGWLDRYIEQGWDSGSNAASEEVGVNAPYHLPRALIQLGRQEISGILAALTQQVSRSASYMIETKPVPPRAFRCMVQPFDSIRKRLIDFTEWMTVKAHNDAKLAVYEINGIDELRLIPEMVHVVTDARNLAGIRTAGDDRVCDRCNHMAQRSPYTLARAKGLIPLHPRCRCSWYLWTSRVS